MCQDPSFASPPAASDPDAAVRVFWRPGCSSCAKVKDYLTARAVPFVSVDVVAEPAAMALLAERGIRSVPVVMRGAEFTFAQSLDDVARFLELPKHTVERLAPAELVARWIYFLEAAKALAARVPPDLWSHAPQPEVTLLHLNHHALRIPLSFLACVEDGVQDWVSVAMAPPPPGTGHEELTELADQAIVRLRSWWTRLADKSCAWPVTKYDGVHSAHVFLERQVWHSTHHVRQVADALHRLGVDVDGIIDPARYAGLPLPERIW